MSPIHESNPFLAYLAHLSAVPVGIYKAGYNSFTNNQASVFSESQHGVDCRTSLAFQSAKSAETENLETPKDLKNSEEVEYSHQLPATHLTFSSLSSAIHSGNTVNQRISEHSFNTRSNSTFTDISPELWRKISRISALLQNLTISMSHSKNYSESSKFMSRLSESSVPSSSFDTSLGSFSASMHASDLKQIANMLNDVINSSLKHGQPDGVVSSEVKLGREIDELVAQYNDIATIAISSGSEVPLIPTAFPIK